MAWKYHLKKHPKGYPAAHALFYGAQIFNGLSYLHSSLVATARPLGAPHARLVAGPEPFPPTVHVAPL